MIKKKFNIKILISIFTILFFIPRIYYLFSFPYPEIYPDSFDYYYLSSLILDSNYKAISLLPYDFPMGYPIFLAFMELFAKNLNTVIAFQIFIKYIACLLFIISINKYEPKLTLVLTIALCFYVLDGWTLRFDTTILTESLFTSSIIIFSAILFWVLDNINSKRRILLLSLFTIVPIFIRSNGIFVYAIIVFLALFFIIKKVKVINYFYLFTPILIINLFFAYFTFEYTDGIGFPGNYFRLKKTFSSTLINLNSKISFSDSYFLKNLLVYSRMPDSDYFFHDKIIQRYKRLVTEFNKDNINYMFDNKLIIPENIKALVYKEFYYKQLNKPSPEEIIKKSIPLWIFKGFIKTYNLFIRNIAFFLIFIIASFVILYLILFNKNKSHSLIFLFYISTLYLSNLIFISYYSSKVFTRYVLIFDFAVYIVVFYFLIHLFNFIYRTLIKNKRIYKSDFKNLFNF